MAGNTERCKVFARKAGEIITSDEYLDAVEAAVCDDQLLAELQANPRAYLQRRGVQIPAGFQVIWHWEHGKPSIHFHWEEEPHTTKEERELGRDLMRKAADLQTSERYIEIVAKLESNDKAMSEMAADPKAYFEKEGLKIPEGIEVIHHPEAERLRIDFHWKVARKANCYYMQPCCCYAELMP